MQQILVIEDNVNLSNAIKLYLERSGFAITQAFDGEEGALYAQRQSFDLIVLDIMLPIKDGWEILEDRGRFAADTPIIVLSAKGDIDHRLKGYDLGADDYIPKPFSLKELVAKIRAVLRRGKTAGDTAQGKDLFIDHQTRSVVLHGQRMDFTPMEYELFTLLAAHPNRVYSREDLLDLVWGQKEVNDFRTVDTHIKQIRSKLGENRQWIKTIWGVGYKFEALL